MDALDATLNITWSGNNGDLTDPVPYDSTDVQVISWAKEAIQNGDVPGIPADPNVDFTDFIVDRYAATDELPSRLFLRPKTPFGC